MVRIGYSGMEIRIEGHAGYAEAGADLVCAALSGIWYTLVAKLERDMERGRLQYEAREGPGSARVRLLHIAGGYEQQAREIWDMVLCGFLSLSSQYPGNVQVQKKI